MTFLEAVVKIANSNGKFTLCTDEEELLGLHMSLCVYDDKGDFCGKLRWPTSERPASVDEELEIRLKEIK
jgi:hypothetical protein